MSHISMFMKFNLSRCLSCWKMKSQFLSLNLNSSHLSCHWMNLRNWTKRTRTTNPKMNFFELFSWQALMMSFSVFQAPAEVCLDFSWESLCVSLWWGFFVCSCIRMCNVHSRGISGTGLWQDLWKNEKLNWVLEGCRWFRGIFHICT